ncbi:MAG: amidohydrolase family protein [Candidatus Bipolaricaulota bacterium]|nr:amidohydrolase family protein [Candidatus Bipolaricaulota bacterium]
MITLVTNIHQLVTPRGTEPAAGAAMSEVQVRAGVTLVIRDDRIVAVEPTGATLKGDRVIDARGGVVVPGLVDACLTAQSCGVRAEVGAHGLPGASESHEERDLRQLRVGMETLLRHGTTSSEIRAEARDGDAALERILAGIQQLVRCVPLRLSAAFLGAPQVGMGSERSDRITKLIGETIPTVSRRHLASTCVLLCGEGGYGRKEGRAVLRAARGAGLTLKIQAAGADADAILLAAELEVASVDHLASSAPDARQLSLLKKAGTIPVLLPAEPLAREGSWGTARPFVDAGLVIALGSSADLGSGGVLSMWTGVALAVRKLGLSLAEAITAATLNAAAVIGSSPQVGTLEPGKFADLVILDVDDYRVIPGFLVGLPIRAVIVGGTELFLP